MKDTKNSAPDILTNKDLDYLKDIFGWNYTLYKFTENNIDNIEDKEIIKLFKECGNIFYDNMNLVIDILAKEDGNE